MPLIGIRTHFAVQLAQLRKHLCRKRCIRPRGDDRNHALKVRTLEVFGPESVQVRLHEVIGNVGREG